MGRMAVSSLPSLLVASICVCLLVRPVEAHYHNQFAVCLDGRGALHAERVAQQNGFHFVSQVVGDCYLLEQRSISKRSIHPSHSHVSDLRQIDGVTFVQQQHTKSRVKRSTSRRRPVYLNDPRWLQMWYLNRGSGMDMNVQGAWSKGFTGQGVVVTILDDGLEKDHSDLQANYDPVASYDVNSHDQDPQPRYDLADSNRHGTRCAGEVAGIANNSLCAVGVAFEANIGGVRMLDGEVTDAVEARSLSLNQHHIDIYSASWGPDDDGETVDGPGELAKRAFREGIINGRGGKGSIFVWASGNGGRERDNCNCDGYTNSLWTLSISSATEYGHVPWYSEACSSTLATTYSSGSNDEAKIVTTDLHNGCTTTHTGTSASAPLAAGICALALQANSELTWRDMQHIVVRTARKANLQAPDWITNGVGRNVSHSFGYGLMDATAMVELAERWIAVPEQRNCQVPSNHLDKLVPPHSKVVLTLNVNQCDGVNFMEHVQARITLDATHRGDIKIFLTSPAGTTSTLLARRPRDMSRAGFRDWPFMTTHCWDESPTGTWSLEVHNDGRYPGQVVLSHWALLVSGVPHNPNRLGVESPPASTTVAAPAHVPTPPPSGLHARRSDHAVAADQAQHPGTVSNWALVIFGTEVEAGTAPPAAAADSTPPAVTPPAAAAAASTLSTGCVALDPLSSARCLVCGGGLLLWMGTCLSRCPNSSYVSGATCLPCHYTCATCKAAAADQCSSCFPDAVMWPRHGESGSCVSAPLVQQLQSAGSSGSWGPTLLAIFVLVTLLVPAGLLVVRRLRRDDSPHRTTAAPYTDSTELNGFHAKPKPDVTVVVRAPAVPSSRRNPASSDECVQLLDTTE